MTNRTGGDARSERFRTYYQRFYRRVVRFYVHSFRFTDEDAEDLAQEAFTRFYESMDEYRGEAEWAFFETIARHVAYNRIRSRKTLKRSVTTVDLDDPEVSRNEPSAPAEPDYADRQHAELRRKQMYEAIHALPDGQRECLHLWLTDLTYDEIARALRISLDAVKSRIRDAKRVLRARLGDHGLPEDER